MKFVEIQPGERLKPYVQCYFLIESETSIEFADTIFPRGFIEIAFNLGEAIWKSAREAAFYSDPAVELLGQNIQPVSVKTAGRVKMLGIRFFPHTAVCFLDGEMKDFNNQIADLRDLFHERIRTLHERLIEAATLADGLALIESFLLKRLSITEGRLDKMALITQAVQDLTNNHSGKSIEYIAARYNISSRYLQKLFLQYIGVTPKIFAKINRFQQSLTLLNSKNVSLTSVAYDCGYFDQSHFIKEFKLFSGTTPTTYLNNR